MKFLGILLLAAICLWNISYASTTQSELPTQESLAKAENALNNIRLNDQNPLRDIDINLNNYSELLKIFNEFQVYDIKFTTTLLSKISNQNTLSGLDLFVLRRTMLFYYKINQKILSFAKIYEFSGFKMSHTFASEYHKLPLVKAHLLWLSAHLLTLEQLEIMHNLLYESNGDLRRILKNALLDKNNMDTDTTKTLKDFITMSKQLVEVGESSKFSQQIILIRNIRVDLKELLSKDMAARELLDLIATNKLATDITQGTAQLKIKNFSFLDSLYEGFTNFTGFLSKTFGNFAGSVKWRKGYLYKNEVAKATALENLRPMDILIEKSPFVLTDKFIPGHYGHIAVYLGTKKQLESINMWNHPDIIPYQEEILAGKVILEAVRPGVHLNSLEEFLNIDELTIMTKVDGLSNPSLVFEEISQGMQQIGKAYDFNFDITTLDKIVCSELIYITFGNVHWPTKYRLGRPTITPDDAAEILFQKNTKFKIKNFMVAKKENKIEQVDMSYIAGELDYELRASDGTPIQDLADKTNSYWKKETKCYTVSSSAGLPSNRFKRVCNTSYKEFLYEERNDF